MQKCKLIACFLLAAIFLNAQTPKSWEINYLEFVPELDGRLNDSCWQILTPLTAFTTSTPIFGNAPHCQTELRVYYTQTAMYLAAYCYDPDKNGVRRDAGIRDGAATGDWLRISLDTWNDDQLAFDFTVTAAGVQQDSRQYSSGWDARWQSAVQQQADGWTVEICIPFTALRFPKIPEHTWGAQFSRYDRSSGELSTWSPQDPLVQDRVIQFGTLTGIRDIRQRRRLSMAVHSETAMSSETQPTFGQRVLQKLGIDGRIGLNESATLDLTLISPQNIQISRYTLFPSTNITYLNPEPLPEPRQFLEEERDLFDKHIGLNYNPIIDASALIWRKPPNGINEIADGVLNAKVFQASKLSARTNGKWRFGVFNALLGPAKAEYRNNTGGRRKETLQALSDYLFVGAEYLLPNNSYLHVSNSTLLAGKGMTSADPQVNFRLRDRTNSLEIAGASGLGYRHQQDDKYLDYFWNLSLARINRRWGWSLRHNEGNQPIIQPDDAPSHYRNAYSRAQVQYRSFRPWGPFLNLNAGANLDVRWQGLPVLREEWNIGSSVTALDKGFRLYALQLYTKPHNRLIRYQQSGVYIDQKISPEIGSNLSFQTDNRKRFQLGTSAAVSAGLDGEFPNLFLSLRPAWVLGQRLRLFANLNSNTYFKSLSLLDNTSGSWIFEQSDQSFSSGFLGLDWYPASHFQLTTSIGIYKISEYHRKAVELLDGGILKPVDWVFSENSFKPKPTYRLDASYFFSSISQLRLHLDYQPENRLTFGTFPPTTIGPAWNAKLSLIWFLDGTKKS